MMCAYRSRVTFHAARAHVSLRFTILELDTIGTSRIPRLIIGSSLYKEQD